MLAADLTIKLGEWLPDLPYYQNPGLVEARNCIPVDDSYTDFAAVTTSGDALVAAPIGAFAAVDSTGEPEIYAGTATALYERVSSSWTDRSDAAYTALYWQFAQFDSYVLATNYADRLRQKTIGAAANFAAITAAPFARQIGVINRFVVLGDLDQGSGDVPYATQWCALDDPTDWPIPGTSDARTKQAGEQYLQAEHGAVTAIAGGQFWGLVFQKRGITRYTYVGGDIVFQIDNYERSRGCWCPRSHIQVGNLSYFIAADGFYVTDGQSVSAIGDGKVDRWFLAILNQGELDKVTVGVNWDSKCIYWSFPTVDSSPDTIAIFNFVRNRWSYANQTVDMLFTSFTSGVSLDELDALYPDLDAMTISLDSSIWKGGIPTVQGFSGSALGSFGGSSLVAVIETGEGEAAPFGRMFIRGVRPLITGNPTAVTVALSVRDTQDNASRTFGTPVSRTTRTGVCDFRTQGTYVSSRLTVTGGFDRAMALQFDPEQGDGL